MVVGRVVVGRVVVGRVVVGRVVAVTCVVVGRVVVTGAGVGAGSVGGVVGIVIVCGGWVGGGALVDGATVADTTTDVMVVLTAVGTGAVGAGVVVTGFVATGVGGAVEVAIDGSTRNRSWPRVPSPFSSKASQTMSNMPGAPRLMDPSGRIASLVSAVRFGSGVVIRTLLKNVALPKRLSGVSNRNSTNSGASAITAP